MFNLLLYFKYRLHLLHFCDILPHELISTRYKHAYWLVILQQLIIRATWAWRRRGFGQLRRGEAGEAATALQTVLRDQPADAAAWEGLGAAYEALGRLTAALKVCYVVWACLMYPRQLFAHVMPTCAGAGTSCGVPVAATMATRELLSASFTVVHRLPTAVS